MGEAVRTLGLLMMMSGMSGVLLGYLGSMSPWTMDINLWLFPNFLNEDSYPEVLFLLLFAFSIPVWLFGTMLRHWPRPRADRMSPD